MISHVLVYLLTHGGKDPILHTLCHTQKMGVQPFGLADWLYAYFMLYSTFLPVLLCQSRLSLRFPVVWAVARREFEKAPWD